jgi:hypothetical protein
MVRFTANSLLEPSKRAAVDDIADRSDSPAPDLDGKPVLAE